MKTFRDIWVDKALGVGVDVSADIGAIGGNRDISEK